MEAWPWVLSWSLDSSFWAFPLCSLPGQQKPFFIVFVPESQWPWTETSGSVKQDESSSCCVCQAFYLSNGMVTNVLHTTPFFSLGSKSTHLDGRAVSRLGATLLEGQQQALAVVLAFSSCRTGGFRGLGQ